MSHISRVFVLPSLFWFLVSELIVFLDKLAFEVRHSLNLILNFVGKQKDAILDFVFLELGNGGIGSFSSIFGRRVFAKFEDAGPSLRFGVVEPSVSLHFEIVLKSLVFALISESLSDF